MNKIRLIILIAAVALASCKKDNFDAPDAGLSGNFYDENSTDLVPQDIINGTQIELREQGYANVAPQYLIVKADGTYSNTLLFANDYKVIPTNGNFVPIDTQLVKINGQTKLDFRVKPYIRIKDASIVRNGAKITATFKVQQSVINNVSKIGLYAHRDPRVGEPMRDAFVEQTINAVVDPAKVWTLEFTVPNNELKAGTTYYFRVGALISATGTQAKFNYAPTVVKITI